MEFSGNRKNFRRSYTLLVFVLILELTMKSLVLGDSRFPVNEPLFFSFCVLHLTFAGVFIAGIFQMDGWVVPYAIFYSCGNIFAYPAGGIFGLGFKFPVFLVLLIAYGCTICLFSSPIISAFFFSTFQKRETPWKKGKFKLLLVKPHVAQDLYCNERWNFPVIPSLTLPHIAALTPEDFEVDVFDEDTHECLTSVGNYDLVAISVLEKAQIRAREIFYLAKGAGKPLIVGGCFPTTCPEKAKDLGDAMVIGDAEGIWEKVLKDFAAGKLEKIYSGGRPGPMTRLPPPRLNLLDSNRYLGFTPVQTSRGCNFRCDFCSIKDFYRGISFRPVDEVVSEISLSNPRLINFVDTNIFIDKERFKCLCEGLKPLKIHWIAQSTNDIGEDPALLELAGDSGCLLLYLGVESLDERNAEILKKKIWKPDVLEKYLENIRQAGILSLASFIVGLEYDSPEGFLRLREFSRKSGISFLALSIYRPVEGHSYHAQLRREGRMLEGEKILRKPYGIIEFIPKAFDPESLYNEYLKMYKEFYSFSNISGKLRKTRLRSSSKFFFELSYYLYHWFLFRTMKGEI